MCRERTAAAIAIACGLCSCVPDAGDEIPSEKPPTAPGDGERFSLYVHGRHAEGVPERWTYWGGDPPPGVTPVAVNYDGGACISEANPVIVNTFDAYCRGTNACYVACHSMGCAHVGYALSRHGWKTDGEPRWNILWVDAAGSAAGGSELADDGAWAYDDCAISDLQTNVVRTLYDHNATTGVTFYMFAGARGSWWSGLLDGQDDEIVAYHSAGGARYAGSFCNPGDWYCDAVLERGASSQLYAYHQVYFRDDGERYNHTIGTGGITAPLFEDMAAFAR